MNFNKILLGITLWLIFVLTGCDLNKTPTNGKTDEQALNSLQGLQTATYGNYKMFKGSGGDYSTYVKYIFQIGEYGSDNVTLSGTTEDPLYYSYNYNHNKNMENIQNLWRWGYRIIYGANKIIENVSEGESTAKDQLLGENIFLRALVHFQLVNFFGRPYVQVPESNLGIPIRTDTDIDAQPKRNTVKEVYDFVIPDLKKAADLMTLSKPNIYASKEVAWALLSRVYLYMGENKKAIENANKVISSGRYELVNTETFKKYFTIVPENNSETIFAIKQTQSDNHNFGAISSMYYTSPGGTGWGEMYASKDYRKLLDKYPDDVRHSFIQADYETDEEGDIVNDENGNPVIKERNSIPRWFIKKFTGQGGHALLSSPVILRLAEMYLNRAEAYAKLGQDQKAIDDVNRIRKRAGLSGNELYSASDLKGHNSILDVVLEERRLEFAFEAQRRFDLFRNNRSLVRNYPGFHLNQSNPGVDIQDSTQIIPPDHPRVVFFIPETEIQVNPNLKQNP